MKEFEIPEIRVISFSVEDIITTSGGGFGGSGDDSGAFVPGGGAWEDELPR